MIKFMDKIISLPGISPEDYFLHFFRNAAVIVFEDRNFFNACSGAGFEVVYIKNRCTPPGVERGKKRFGYGIYWGLDEVLKIGVGVPCMDVTRPTRYLVD